MRESKGFAPVACAEAQPEAINTVFSVAPFKRELTWCSFKSLTTDALPAFIHSKGCPKGFFGKNCNKPCNCANSGHCHRLYGACLCDPGLYGRFCHLSKSQQPS